MKYKILAFLLISISHLNFSLAASQVSCQMQILKVATEAYDANWLTFTKLTAINSISFQYPANGLATVIFAGSHNSTSGETCNLEVHLSYTEDPLMGGCPEYTFSGLNSSCK